MAHPALQPHPADVLNAAWRWAVAAGLVALVVTAAAIPRQALVGVFYDDGIYLALARSLAEGGGYRLPFLPGAPPGVHYPVLYPAFLALLWKVGPAFPANVVVMRLANAALMAGFVAVAARYLAARLGLKEWLVALVVVLTAAAVPLLAVATVLFSEPLFLVLAAAACWAADAGSQAEGRRGLLLAALAGTLAAGAALTRSIGVAVGGGVVVALLCRRRWREAGVAAALVTGALAPWWLWVRANAAGVDPAIAANYGTYGDLLRQAGAGWLSLHGLMEVARPLGAIALPPVGGPARLLLAVPALGLMVLGLATLMRRAPAAGWMMVVYTGIVAVWPYAPDRFLWAALPWLAVCLSLGIATTLVRASRWAPAGRATVRVMVGVVAASIVLPYLIYQGRGLAGGAATAAQRGISETFAMVLPWIREHTPPEAVIATEDEALVWLYTGRKAVPSYLWKVKGRGAESLGPDSLKAWLDRSGATHLLLTGPGSDAAPTVDALIARYPGYLRVAYAWPGQVLAFTITGGGGG